MTHVISREQLFQEVWAEPMSKVAERYGISDVGLKKICRKHEIPTPGRGYWARKAAGKTSKIPRLRRLDKSSLNTIQIYGVIRGISSEAIKRADR